MYVGLRVSICTKGLAYLIAVQIVEQISFGCRPSSLKYGYPARAL